MLISLRTIALLFILLTSPFVFTQNFNGSYKSEGISFANHEDPTQNFIEENTFNISVGIFGDEGYVACQDPRLPDKILIYQVNSAAVELEGKYIYWKCLNEHIGDGSASNLVFYDDDHGNLNLMISSGNTSQVFRDLEKVD